MLSFSSSPITSRLTLGIFKTETQLPFFIQRELTLLTLDHTYLPLRVQTANMATTAEKLKRTAESTLNKVDKEKLKANFDTSNFNINAVIRGIQLTLVGGKLLIFICPSPDVDTTQPKELSRTQPFLPMTTINRLQLLLLLV